VTPEDAMLGTVIALLRRAGFRTDPTDERSVTVRIGRRKYRLTVQEEVKEDDQRSERAERVEAG